MLQAAQDAIAGGVSQYPPRPWKRSRYGRPSPPSGGAISSTTTPRDQCVYGRSHRSHRRGGARTGRAGSGVLLIDRSTTPTRRWWRWPAPTVTVPLVPDGRGFALGADALRRAVT